MKLHLIKLLKILAVALMLVSIFSNIAFAAFNVKDTFNGNIDSNAESAKTEVKKVLLEALTAVRYAGIAIAMIILIVIGIKIMSAAPSERANVKQYSMNYLIGVVVLVGATGIIGIIQSVAETAFGN